MMRFASMLALVLICGASGVSARTIRVQSGEHDTFTRLVLTVSQPGNWTVETSGGQAVVRSEAGGHDYDFSKVFSRIPKDRLMGLRSTPSGDGIVLELGCNCPVESFEQSGKYLVVDIKDADPDNPKTDRQAGLLSALRMRSRLHSVPVSTLRPHAKAETQLTLSNAASRSPSRASASPPEARVAPRIDLSEQRLVAQLRRAAEQGLLNPTVEPGQERSAIPERPIPGQETPREPASDANTGLSAVTVFDRDLRKSRRDIRIGPGEKCVPPDRLEITAWGTEDAPAKQIADHRKSLAGSLDDISPHAAITLARTFVFLGFGAEARHVLALGQATGRDVEVLKGLADILDPRPRSEEGIFADMQNCPGPAALWAVLSKGAASRNLNKDSVLRSFVKLPTHLRSYLAPPLSQRLSAAGHRGAAETVLRSARRVARPDDPAIELASIGLNEAGEEPAEDVEGLKAIVRRGATQSPEALIKLIDSHWQKGTPLPPDLHLLVSAYEAELGGSTLGPPLRRAKILAGSLTGEHALAFAALERAAGVDDAEEIAEAAGAFLSILTERGSDITFLTLASRVVENGNLAIPAADADSAARRFHDLGFSDLAGEMLSISPATEKRSEDRRMLLARLALDGERPHRALVELLGVADPDAVMLRQEAMRAIDGSQSPVQGLAGLEIPTPTPRDTWLSGSWDPTVSDRSPYAKMAKLAMGLTLEVQDGDAGTDAADNVAAPLAQARSLLADSISVRSEIEALMALAAEAAETEAQQETQELSKEQLPSM